MPTMQLTVGPDGRVVIPGTQPGQTVTINIADVVETTDPLGRTGPIPEEEWAVIEARVKRLAEEIRRELPEPWLSSDHGDLLYGDDGLPK